MVSFQQSALKSCPYSECLLGPFVKFTKQIVSNVMVYSHFQGLNLKVSPGADCFQPEVTFSFKTSCFNVFKISKSVVFPVMAV